MANARALISRTGYTGEDGFEIFVPPNTADRVWQALLESGAGAGVVPCGLGARDTLRLEAGMRLYGNDIDDTTTPVEAGLNWIVGWNKPSFVGADALRKQKAQGPEQRLVGFELTERGIARQGHGVVRDGTRVGHVTSGTQTPFLKKAIGMAYVPPDLAAAGTELDIDIRGRVTKAVVVKLPFYKRGSASLEPGARSLEPDHMSYPTDLRYTKDHEWVGLSGDVAEVGITDYAQQQLGDVVYVDLPAVGARLDGRRRLRHHRVGEGSVGAVRARRRRGGGAERGAEGSSRVREHGPAPDMDGPHHGGRRVGRRRPAGRGAVRSLARLA